MFKLPQAFRSFPLQQPKHFQGKNGTHKPDDNSQKRTTGRTQSNSESFPLQEHLLTTTESSPSTPKLFSPTRKHYLALHLHVTHLEIRVAIRLNCLYIWSCKSTLLSESQTISLHYTGLQLGEETQVEM